jgi:hypothetical protein
MLSKYNIIIISLSDKGCLMHAERLHASEVAVWIGRTSIHRKDTAMLDIVAIVSFMFLSVILTASLWRQRRVESAHVSLLGVMFTIIFLYSAATHYGSVYKNYEAAAWAALAAYTVAAILAAAEYRLRVLAWISRLWIRRAQSQKISALVKMAEMQLSLSEQAWRPREGYSPESPESPDTDA